MSGSDARPVSMITRERRSVPFSAIVRRIWSPSTLGRSQSSSTTGATRSGVAAASSTAASRPSVMRRDGVAAGLQRVHDEVADDVVVLDEHDVDAVGIALERRCRRRARGRRRRPWRRRARRRRRGGGASRSVASRGYWATPAVAVSAWKPLADRAAAQLLEERADELAGVARRQAGHADDELVAAPARDALAAGERRFSAPATARRAPSPAAWPSLSLSALKPSRSMTARLSGSPSRSAAAERLGQRLVGAAAVGQPGQRVGLGERAEQPHALEPPGDAGQQLGADQRAWRRSRRRPSRRPRRPCPDRCAR